MIDSRFLEILACPRCKGDLTARPDLESLVCGACALRYEIRAGIPVLLIDEAEPTNSASAR